MDVFPSLRVPVNMDRIHPSLLPPDPILKPLKRKAVPGQIKPYNNVMDRLELLTLLNHLSPQRRVAFLAWVCSQAVLPCSNISPQVALQTRQLADEARHCDRANERLTITVLMDWSHISIDYAVSLDRCVERLVLMARGNA